jgi:hypothetical protein
MQSRRVFAGHYSEFNIPLVTPNKLVRISVTTEAEKVCYQLNVFCRAGDIPAEKKLLEIPSDQQLSPSKIRNNFYSKLKTEGYITPGNWRWNEVDIFVFPMGALYNIYQLYQTLQELAVFLEHSFNPDASLNELWEKFIMKNHGWNYWINANNTLEKILANANVPFESDAWAQAILNYLISNSVGMHDGPLHDNDHYPGSTAEMYQIIQTHIAMFDQRF